MPELAAVATRPSVGWLVGFLVGSLVNAAGVGLWVSGVGPPGSWVPVAVAAVVGAAVATITPRFRWLGLGLAAGCVAEAGVLAGLVLIWGTVAGSAVS